VLGNVGGGTPSGGFVAAVEARLLFSSLCAVLRDTVVRNRIKERFKNNE
jgi:hypothetical protein